MTRRGQALELAGLVAAVVLAFLVNGLAMRHFTRWDWTRDRRYTLSPATLDTLHTLEQRVEVWAIAGSGDPVARGLEELLVAYQAASSRVEVHWIDPDRDVAQLVALQARFGLQAGKAEDGRIATDAVVVVAAGDRHWFLTAQDLYESASDDVHVKPREERALTSAVRSVIGGERAKLCFTVGHGELPLDPTRDEREGMGALRDLLEKGNYEVASVDLAPPAAHEPLAGCTVAVIAGMHAPFSPQEANRLRTWLLEGGSLLAAIGPLDPVGGDRMPPAGLDDVLRPFGIELVDDLVHDVDAEDSIPETHGEGFFVRARPHPVTVTLTADGPDAHPPRIAAFFTRSMRPVVAEGASPAPLLVTGSAAYGRFDVAGAERWTDAPPRAAGDEAGPFVIGMASERPRIGSAAHGPRAVVLGSRYFLAEDNWRQPRPLHGAAFLVDSALSWLAARPQVVDVPERAEVAAGMRISEASRAEVQRYVLLLMPLAAALLGAAVWGWRRASENKPYERAEGRRPPA